MLKRHVKTLGIAVSLAASVALADSPTSFKSHMEFLASDLLEGRDTGSQGHEIASLYIASQFERLDVKPAVDGSYFQRIEFGQTTLVKDSGHMHVMANGERREFAFGAEMVTWPSSRTEKLELHGDLVFVGYGIDAPWLDYSDYQGLDVEGKIVVALSAKPKQFPSEEGTYYSNQRYNAAADRGAIGWISIGTPEGEARRSFESRSKHVYEPSSFWRDEQGRVGGRDKFLQGGARLSVAASKELFEMAGLDYDAIIAAHETSEPVKGRAMGVTAHIKNESKHSMVTSPNVVGVLEGSDPKLKNEYVLLTAHSDHVGVKDHAEEGEDKIYNGALDNSSGVTTLIEVARMFKESGVRPKRSILFAAVTAEEQGLLGSEYLAKNPVVPIKQIVANVNLDMPILTYDAQNLVAFGVEHSTMDTAIQKGVESQGFNLIPDPLPSANIFARSDQFSFVKEGVPAVFLFMDLTAEGGEGEVGAKAFMAKHYHKVSDDLNLPIDYNLAARFVKANYEIAKNLADQEKAPRWKDESFFKSLDDR